MASKMAADLLSQITSEFGGDTVNRLASAVGISPAKTTSALESLVPAVLSGVAAKASTADGANDVIDVIRKNNLTSLNLSDATSSEGVARLAGTGRSLLDFVLGGRVEGVTDWISSNLSLSRASVTSLASMVVPLLLGSIGRRLGSGGMNASSLSNLLGSSSKFMQYAPAGFASVLGLGGAAAATHRVLNDREGRVIAAPAYVAERPSPWKWLVPLLLVAGLIGLGAYLFSRRAEPTPVATQRPEQTSVPAAPAPAAPAPVVPSAPNLGAFIDTKLPNGVSLHIPTNGVENKLLAFIGDTTKAVDKETWFSFDRLEFETDSATLKPSSREQLGNIAAILKAYPQVNVKIGGYTDNTGDVAHNVKLSQDRANSTMNELVSLGIAKPRLAAEGYGEKFPVADNSTPEGRQRNRRIDIRVTKK
jgi:OmpA-OmpF porin, OOP family